MKTIRKITQITGRELKVIVPAEYEDAEVEVIIRPIATSETNVVNEPRVDYGSLYGSIKLGSTVEEINLQLKKLRDERDRDIS